MRKTKIICTIGPASENEEVLTQMCLAGMNVARLNFSHGRHPEHEQKVALIKRVRQKLNLPSAILLEIGRNCSASAAKLLKSICKNAIVQAAVIALVLKLLSLEIPAMAEDVAFDLAGMATPLSFLSLGVSLDIGAIGRNRKPLVLGIGTRLVLIPLIFVTAAIALGFRGPELCAIFLLFAAPTAVSSYPLAVSMDADPELAGQMVIFTTVCCLPTFFLWVMAMSSLGLF